MAWNTLSGTVYVPENFIPKPGAPMPIVSGNLATSDGASIQNVPRVSNATHNGLVCNVDGDANTFTCGTDLTFDGTALSVTGEITSSTGISASYLMGDGSRLTGIDTGGGSGAGAQGPVYSLQFTTGSGGISGSADLIFSSSILTIGGGLTFNRTEVSSDYSASTLDYYIGVNTSLNAEPISIGLPSATLLNDGQTYVVKDEGGEANAKNISIATNGSDTIDGQNSVVLESPYSSIQIYCNGTNKYFIY